MYRLSCPPAWLTPFQRLIWPLIFWQILCLRARVRAAHGPGVPYRFQVSPWGRVTLLGFAHHLIRSETAAATLFPARLTACLFSPSVRLSAALAAPQTAPLPSRLRVQPARPAPERLPPASPDTS